MSSEIELITSGGCVVPQRPIAGDDNSCPSEKFLTNE